MFYFARLIRKFKKFFEILRSRCSRTKCLRAQAAVEYFLIFAAVAAIALLSVSVFYDRAHTVATDFFRKSAIAIMGEPVGGAGGSGGSGGSGVPCPSSGCQTQVGGSCDTCDCCLSSNLICELQSGLYRICKECQPLENGPCSAELTCCPWVGLSCISGMCQ